MVTSVAAAGVAGKIKEGESETISNLGWTIGVEYRSLLTVHVTKQYVKFGLIQSTLKKFAIIQNHHKCLIHGV